MREDHLNECEFRRTVQYLYCAVNFGARRMAGNWRGTGIEEKEREKGQASEATVR